MAEARSYVGSSVSVTGVRLGLTDDELRLNLSLNIPLSGAVFRYRIRHQLRRLHNLIVNGSYPLGPLIMVVVVGIVTTLVTFSDRDSWIRQGWLGSLVWNIGMLFPVVGRLPLLVRVAYFTMIASFIGFFLLMALQRVLLRILFSNQTMLYASRQKKRPWSLLVWAALVKVLSGRKPLTYGFTTTLPSRPLPKLEDTCRRWLESERPLQTAEEFAKTTKMVEQFLSHEGPKLQRYLRLKWLVSDNFVADWWEKYCYHKGRSSIMINSNYYVLDGAFMLPTHRGNARAGQLVHNILEYNLLVEEERIPPMVVGGMLPLDMSQHQRMFATTRVPGRDCDAIEHYHYSVCKHIVVMCAGYYFKVMVIRKDGSILTARELEDLFDYIKAEVARLGTSDSATASLPAMTAANRTEWAELREQFFASGLNASSLRDIESAILLLVLDEEEPADFTAMAHSLLHGNGINRWFDKSLTVVAFNNGRIGLNCEHSWADAPVIAHLMEWTMMTGELLEGVYQEDGHTKRDPPSGPVPPIPTRVLFDLPHTARTKIFKAVDAAKEAIADLDLIVMPFDAYGKGFVKTLSVSPDAYVQMAIQITNYRLSNKFVLTYESGMARLFKAGRTETIRPVSEQSVGFVTSFLDDDVPAQRKLELLRAASEKHVKTSLDAMTGKGVDRHLFALYIVSVGKSIESDFLKTALSEPWTLSTSQQPPNQTTRYNPKRPADAQRLGMGGGFGPVAQDGYGVSYLVAGENHIFFHISSKHSCEHTGSQKFGDTLKQTLLDMQRVLGPFAKKKAAAPKATSASAKKSQ